MHAGNAPSTLSAVSHFYIRTPFGPRPVSEFTYGGEVRPPADPSGTELDEIRRLWMRRNACGIQRERGER